MSLFSNETLEHMRDCASQYASGVYQLITGVLWLETENAELKSKIQELSEACSLAQWTKITPKNLPKVGDELLGIGNKVQKVCAKEAAYGKIQWRGTYWTHFRSIAPPHKEK